MLAKEPLRNHGKFKGSVDLVENPGHARGLDTPVSHILQLLFLSFSAVEVVRKHTERPKYTEDNTDIRVLIKRLLYDGVMSCRHRIIIIKEMHIACFNPHRARRIECKISDSAGPAT